MMVDSGWVQAMARLAAHDSYVYGDDQSAVSGYDASGSSLSGATLHWRWPPEMLDPARRWCPAPPPAAGDGGSPLA